MPPGNVRNVALIFLVLASTATAETSVLPTESCGSYFLVPMTVADDPERVLWAILDTGAQHSLFDPDSIERAYGKKVARKGWVRLRDVAAGPMTWRRLRTSVGDLDHIGQALGRPIDGILGFDSFRELLLVIDYPTREVRVGTGSLPKPDGREVFPLVRTRRPYLELDGPSGRREILLDSGATTALALRERDGLDWASEPTPVGASTRINRIELRRAGRLDGEHRFGPFRLDDPLVELTDGAELAGAQLMKHAIWTFDADGARVRIVADVDAPLDLGPLKGTGLMLGPKDGEIVVLRVIDGSPAAEAGLLEGDRVIRMGGFDMKTGGCERRAWLDEGPATVDHVLERDGRRIEVTLERVVLVP